VVSLDVAGFAQPAPQGFDMHLRGIGVTRFGGLEAAFVLRSGFLERLSVPEEKANAGCQLARQRVIDGVR
jgi:hypothetical protein